MEINCKCPKCQKEYVFIMSSYDHAKNTIECRVCGHRFNPQVNAQRAVDA